MRDGWRYGASHLESTLAGDGRLRWSVLADVTARHGEKHWPPCSGSSTVAGCR
jgi:hypothetical protein